MDNNSSTRYYQKNKDYKKRSVKDIKIFPKKKKRNESTNMLVKNIKIFLNMKNKVYLNIEKIIFKFEKVLCNIFPKQLSNVFKSWLGLEFV